MYIYLKTPYLIYIVDLLTLNSRPKALYRMPERSLLNTNIFSVKHTAIWLLGTGGLTSPLCLVS